MCERQETSLVPLCIQFLDIIQRLLVLAPLQRNFWTGKKIYDVEDRPAAYEPRLKVTMMLAFTRTRFSPDQANTSECCLCSC